MTYEMLAGHLPFESTDASVLREAVLNEKVEPLQDIPVYAQEALARGLSKASSDRFKSCTDFTDAIGGISDAKQIRETKANISTKDNPASSKRHKERIAIIACAFAVITLVALILFFIFDGGKLRLNAITNGADALYKLGLAYENGEGVTKNYVEAVNCYTKAAEQGHAGAQNELGRCYDNGIGVKIDHAEAVKWYRMAADQDYAEAQLNLGRSYYYGNGIEMDMTEAMKWYQRSAENGDDKAQCYLGHYYEDIANYPEALKWYRMAAENGNSEAQFKTGFFLYRTEFSFIEKNYIRRNLF